jgi:hypothetical protein
VRFAVNPVDAVVVTLDATGLSCTEFAARLAAEATGTRRSNANSWQHLADVLNGWQVTGTAALWVIDQVDDAAEDLASDILRLIRLLDRAHAAGTVLLAIRTLADRCALCDAIEFVVSVDRHDAANAA